MTLPQAQVKEAERESTDAARGGSRAGVGLGPSEQRSARSARAVDGPPEELEAERESAHAARGGSRAGVGLGASEEAQRGGAARAPDGPPEEL